MSTIEVVDGYIDYHDRMTVTLLGHKPAERVAAILERIYEYADNVLPDIVIDRRDPIVLRASGESDQ